MIQYVSWYQKTVQYYHDPSPSDFKFLDIFFLNYSIWYWYYSSEMKDSAKKLNLDHLNINNNLISLSWISCLWHYLVIETKIAICQTKSGITIPTSRYDTCIMSTCDRYSRLTSTNQMCIKFHKTWTEASLWSKEDIQKKIGKVIFNFSVFWP